MGLHKECARFDTVLQLDELVAAAEVLVVNRLDLLPYVDYDLAKVRQHALAVNPHLRIFEVSCRTGAGIDAWCAWLVTFARGGM